MALAALAIAAIWLRPPPTEGPYARDYEAYEAAGATWSAGGDAWSRDVWRIERTVPGVDPSRDELLPYVGPAAALPLFALLARAPHGIAVRIWSGMLAGALGALVLAALALARERRVGALLAAFALALASGPAISALTLGQAALMAVAGIALALLAFERGRFVAGACGVLFAGLQPNLALVLIARVRSRAVALACTAAAAVFFGTSLAADRGLAGLREYLRRLGEHGAAERWILIQHTPAAIAWGFGAPRDAAAAIGTIAALAAIAGTIAAIVAYRLRARDGALLAAAALPLAVPFFHEHDFVLTLLPLLVLAVTSTGAARICAALAVPLALVDWLGIAQRPAATTEIVVLGGVLACAFVALGRGRPLRGDAFVLGAFVIVTAVAVPLALTHPAPTWPDRLPLAYRAPAGADMSAVWADEQRRAGLETVEPAWAALRALPLAGSVLTGVAIVLAARPRRP